jgi:hypothetical protein
VNTTLVLVGAVALGGCFVDQLHHYERPARFEAGFNTRHFSPTSGAPVAFRGTGDSPSPTMDTLGGTAMTGTLRFTMAMRYRTYMGADAEVGMLTGQPTSNVAGAYGVVGARSAGRFASIGAELAAGERWVRPNVSAPNITHGVAEPRVRGDLWLSPQVSLGAAVGATLGESVWFAGVYLGFHSQPYFGDR